MKRNAPVNRGGYTWIFLGVAALLAGTYLFGRGEPKETGSVTPTSVALGGGRTAPAFRLSDLNGTPISLNDFRGKVVVLDFWATWCPPCKREIPDFINLQAAYGSQGLQIVGIALDEPGRVQAFARQNGMNYPVLLGSEEVSLRYGGIDGIPTTFIIDKSGEIVNSFKGYRPRAVFEEEIKKLL